MTRQETTPVPIIGSPQGSPANARRDRGTGTIYRAAAGHWVAAVYLANGRRVRRKRLTEAEAQLALSELLRRDDLGWNYTLPRPYYLGTRPRQPRQGVTPRVRFGVLERDGFRCHYCGATAKDARLVVDHVIPVAAGGSDDPANLVTACEPCNLGKGDR